MVELFAAVRANQNATDKMDEAAAHVLGINRTDSRCMDVVQQRGRIAAGELAAETALTTGTVTAVIDRLEAKGYFRRVTDPGDRRRVLVELTDLAQERAAELYGPLADRALPAIGSMTTDQLLTVIDFLERGTEIVERRAAEVRELRRGRAGGGS